MLIVQYLMLKKYSLVSFKNIDIFKLKRLSKFRLEIVQQQTRIKTQLTGYLDIIFPELSSFFKGNLHLKVAYALLEKYPSAKAIRSARINILTNLLYSNSHGRYNQGKTFQLKNSAKESVDLNNPVIDLQIQCLIKQLHLHQKQIQYIDISIMALTDIINSLILTIHGVGYTFGAMIISEIDDIKKFSNPSKLLAFA